MAQASLGLFNLNPIYRFQAKLTLLVAQVGHSANNGKVLGIFTDCLYSQFRRRSFKSINSIRNYINRVKFLHLLHNLPFPNTGSFGLKLTLRGNARINPPCPKQVPPISPNIVLDIWIALDMTTYTHAVMWFLF